MEHTATHASYDIYTLSDDITITKVTSIGQRVRDFIRSHPDKDLVLELSAVKFIDSSGLNLLINIDKNLKNAGQTCYIYQASPEVKNTFDKTKLDQVFNMIEALDGVGRCPKESETLTKYKQYLAEEQDLFRLLSTCPVCSSPHIIGYLIEPVTYPWHWDEAGLVPKAGTKDSDDELDLLGLAPVVCMECFAVSTDIRHFNASKEGAPGIESSLEPAQIAALAKAIKQRRQMMEIGKIVGDVFFEHPRSNEACSLAYMLSAECSRLINKQGLSPCPFSLGSNYYYAFAYGSDSLKAENGNNARTWLMQAFKEKGNYSELQAAQTMFMLINVSLFHEKRAEAENVYNEFCNLYNDSSAEVSDFNNPRFWYSGALFVAGKAGL